MSRSDISAGRAYIELVLRDSKFLRGLKNASEKLKDMGSGVMNLGRSMATAGAAMLLPMGLAVKTFASFDDAIRAVKAVTGATAEEFASLSQKAKDLGASTSFTAIEVAALMTELGRAGFKPDQVEKMTGAVLDLARATGTEAAMSSGIMAAAIRQFGLGAGDATRVADGLTAAANKSFNTVEALGEALSYAGPTAADFGMDIESTLAVLGALGNVGIQGSNAGTAIRRLLTLTGAEAAKMQEIFGVAFVDAAGNARPLVDVLGEVNEVTKDLGTAERAKKFNDAFGLLGITGASAIGKSAVSAKELEDAIRNAGGTAAKTAAEMDSGIGGAFRIALSAIEGVAIAIGETLAEPISTVTKGFTLLAGIIRDFVTENKSMVLTVAGAALALTAAGGALFAIGLTAVAAGTAISGVLSILGLAGTVIGLVLSPLGLITAALVGGASHWAMYSESGQKAVDALIDGFDWLLDKSTEIFGGIGEALKAGDLMLAGRIAMAGLKVIMLKGLEELTGIFGEAFGKIGTQIIGGDFTGAWDTAIAAMMTGAKPFVDFVLGSWDIISNVWDITVDAITAAWDTATDLLSGLWDWFTDSFFGGSAEMAGSWGDFVEGLVSLFTEAAKSIAATWLKTTSAISDFILKDAMEGGILGTAALAGTGVDPATEQGRAELIRKNSIRTDQKLLEQRKADLAAADANGGFINDETTGGVNITSEQLKQQIAELEARLGDLSSTTTDILGDMQTDAKASLAAGAESFTAKMDGIAQRAQERNREKPTASVDATGDEAKDARSAAQAELDALIASTQKAKEDSEAAKKEQESTKKSGTGIALPDVGAASDKVFSTFSAAAFQAAGGVGKDPKKEEKQAAEELKVINSNTSRMVRALERGAVMR